jgi:hypothetical protein
MRADGALHAAPGSGVRGLAEGLAWLWRLGPVHDAPAPGVIGIGDAQEAPALLARAKAGELAGAVVLAGPAGDATAALPLRRAVVGAARLPGIGTVDGEHGVLEGCRPVIRSQLGTHAADHDGALVLAADAGAWGTLSIAWVLEALAIYLDERLPGCRRPLPPVGCLRLDDAPGTTEQQLHGSAKPDRTQAGQLRHLCSKLGDSGAQLVVAVTAQANHDGGVAPTDVVWPKATAVLRGGVEAGVFEPACHGLSHLDERAYREEGRIEPREFLRLEAAEAGQRLDAATTWLRTTIGEPQSFIAPGWGYSPGTLEAARERGLLTWLPPRPGPLLSRQGRSLYETLRVGVPGLHRLDYRPLERIAKLGLPPTVVFHGRLLDNRPEALKADRAVLTLARLLLRRDIARIADLPGVEWRGAARLAELLTAHVDG